MKTRYIYTTLTLALLTLLTACTPTPHDVVQSTQEAEIYPDYKDVTIPVNIAPLNFVVRGAEAVEVKAGGVTINSKGGNVEFCMSEWRELLEENDSIEVEVTALKNGQWTSYKKFSWYVVGDSIEAAQQKLQERGLSSRVVGEGEAVTDQTPVGGAIIPGKSVVVLYAGEDKPEDLCAVPNLVGHTPSEANRIVTNAGLLIRFTGATSSGGSVRVMSQSEEPGTEFPAGTVITVQLGDSDIRD